MLAQLLLVTDWEIDFWHLPTVSFKESTMNAVPKYDSLIFNEAALKLVRIAKRS